MKKVAFYYSLLAMLIVVLGSCSKDDPAPSPGEEQRTFDVVFNVSNVQAEAGFISPVQTIQLVNVLSNANKDKASYVKKADALMSNSNITIEGLKVGSELTGITINLLDNKGNKVYTNNVNLGIPVSDGKLTDSTNPCVTFLGNVASYLATKKSATLQAVVTGGNNDVSNLKITLHTTAIFSW